MDLSYRNAKDDDMANSVELKLILTSLEEQSDQGLLQKVRSTVHLIRVVFFLSIVLHELFFVLFLRQKIVHVSYFR